MWSHLWYLLLVVIISVTNIPLFLCFDYDISPEFLFKQTLDRFIISLDQALRSR